MFWFEERYLPPEWREGDRWRLYWMASRLGFLIFLVGGFHLLVLLSISLLAQFAPLSPEARYSATGVWASILLTFALIVVYRDMAEIQSQQVSINESVSEIQETQNEIMANQTSWIEAGNRPVISIDRWSPQGNSLVFHILNLGRGGAKSLKGQLILYPQEDSTIILDEVILEDDLRDSRNARAISQSAEPLKFSGQPETIDDYDIIDSNKLFDYLSSRMLGEEIVYSIIMSYEDLSGDEHRIEVLTAESDIDDDELTLEGLILNTSQIFTVGRDSGPVDLEGFDLEEV